MSLCAKLRAAARQVLIPPRSRSLMPNELLWLSYVAIDASAGERAATVATYADSVPRRVRGHPAR
jgi:hypothetical protein